jgi:hypothetical protein
MKRNRKRQVRAKEMSPSLFFLGIMGVTMMLSYYIVDSKYTQLGKEVQKSEQELANLMDECIRENAKWTAMTTPEGLDDAMARLGVKMRLPTPEQIVWVTDSGQVVEEKIALAKFRHDLKDVENIARNKQTRGKISEAER